MAEPTIRKVVITGAAGNVGAKVAAHLAVRADLELVLIDRAPPSASEVNDADLSEPGTWTQYFDGADTVVHMAANPHERAAWCDLVADNIDATLNVFRAAEASGVRRVVFASSLQVLLGHEGRARISADLHDWPVNFYGASKSVGERIAAASARESGIAVVCLRLGMVRRGGNLAPSGHPSLAVQRRWLSNRDLCQAVELAIDTEPLRFAIVNVTSANAGSPWTLDEAKRILGYQPLDRHVPMGPGFGRHVTGRVGRVWRRLVGARRH